MTKLHKAVEQNNEALVIFLLKDKATNIHAKNGSGITAIELAYQLGYTSILEKFKENKTVWENKREHYPKKSVISLISGN